MKIMFWAADDSGCGYYRCKVPAHGLRQRGMEVAVSTRWTDIQGGTPGWHHPDVLIGQRVLKDGPSELFRNRSDLLRIYELDDDLLNVPGTNPAFDTYSPPEAQKNIRENIAAADRVIVSTVGLADRISTMHHDVRVVPNYIKAEMLADKPPLHPAYTPEEEFRVGWSGGPTHRADWNAVGNYIKRFINDNPRTRMILIGDLPPAAVTPERTEYREWVWGVEEHLRSLAGAFHVGLAPLVPSLFNRSKSHIKILEYNSQGIPALASPVGEYPSFVEHGFNAGLVPRSDLWRKCLMDLLVDPDLYNFMAQNALDKAAEWTIEDNLSALEHYQP